MRLAQNCTAKFKMMEGPRRVEKHLEKADLSLNSTEVVLDTIVMLAMRSWVVRGKEGPSSHYQGRMFCAQFVGLVLFWGTACARRPWKARVQKAAEKLDSESLHRLFLCLQW